MKKVLCIMIVLLMVITLFYGCKDKEPIETTTTVTEGTTETTAEPTTVLTEPTVAEPKEVVWMMRDIGGTAYAEQLKVYDWMNEVANIRIKPMPVSPDVYMEKLSILVAGNDLPDIVNIGNQDLFIEALTPDFTLAQDIGTKGMLISMSDNLDKLPHYKMFMEKYPDYLGSITAADSKIYLASVVRDYSPTSSLGAVIRADLVPDLVFDSFDDLLQTLTDLRANADGPIWTNRSGLLNLNLLSYSFGTSLMDFPYYDQYQKVFINPVATQNFKDAVIFFKTLVERDILTPEWATYPEPQWYQDSMLGTTLFWVDNMMNVPTMNNGLVTNGLSGEFKALVPPKYNGTFYGWAGKSRFSTTGSVISAKSNAVDEILTLFDWTYDLTMSHDLLYWGEVGITCARLASGDLGNPSPGIQTDKEFNNLLSQIYGVGENSNWMKVFTNVEYYNDRAYDGARKWAPAGKVYGDNVYSYSVPSVALNEAETETMKEILTPLSTYIQENVTNFINGNKSMDEWDAFVAEVSNMKAQELVDIYNGAMGR